MTNRLFNLADMATLLGVTRHWLRAEADAGRVPSLRTDKDFLFNSDAVEKVLAERAAHATEGQEV
jgi:hypothetical protein